MSPWLPQLVDMVLYILTDIAMSVKKSKTISISHTTSTQLSIE